MEQVRVGAYSAMKTFRNISLFMITASVIYAAGAYTGNWFYPNRVQPRKYEHMTEHEAAYTENEPAAGRENSTAGSSQATGTPAASHKPGHTAVPAAGQKKVLNADTEYIIEEYDMATGVITPVPEAIPPQYIGMNRDAFLEAVSVYEEAPSMTDLEKGFLSLEVISFSPEKVVIRKSYQTAVKNNQFCLAVENNYVVVYYGDVSTLFMYTDIKLDSLPHKLQEEIIHVKYMSGEGDLYNFLESYSS